MPFHEYLHWRRCFPLETPLCRVLLSSPPCVQAQRFVSLSLSRRALTQLFRTAGNEKITSEPAVLESLQFKSSLAEIRGLQSRIRVHRSIQLFRVFEFLSRKQEIKFVRGKKKTKLKFEWQRCVRGFLHFSRYTWRWIGIVKIRNVRGKKKKDEKDETCSLSSSS